MALKNDGDTHVSELGVLRPMKEGEEEEEEEEEEEGIERERRNRHYTIIESLRAADWWIWEIASLVISGGALIAMLLLLASLNDKPLPSWTFGDSNCMVSPGSTGGKLMCRPVGISVNAVVSWLGTLTRLCLLVLLSNGLGQMKWSWLARPKGSRSLLHIETFDSASRGSLGSMQLLWKMKNQAPFLAILGAIGIILSIGVDPFIQNLVSYYTRPVPDASQMAFVSNNTFYQGSTIVYLGLDWASPAMMQNAYAALYSSDSNQYWSQPRYECSSGDCTWPAVASIGMCASCEDVSALVSKSCNTTEGICTLSLPESEDGKRPGLSLGYKYRKPGDQQLGTYIAMTSSGIAQVDTAPNSIASIYLNIDPNPPSSVSWWTEDPSYTASLCTLTPCIQSIQSQYRQSTQSTTGASPYTEQVLKTWRCEDLDTTQCADPSFVTNLTAPIAPQYGLDGQTFGINSTTTQGLVKTLARDFEGYIEQLSSQSISYKSASFSSGAARDTLAQIWTANLTGCAYPDNRVSCAVDLVAKALSKTMRDEPFYLTGDRGVRGVAMKEVIHVHVTWYWAVLPVLVWVLALCVFLGIVVGERGERCGWRNSVLPVIFMRVEGEDKDGSGGVRSGELERRARGMEGRVDVRGGEVAFVRG